MIDRGALFTAAGGGLFRVLGVEKGAGGKRVVHVFGMDDAKSLPKQWSYSELEEGLKEGLYERLPVNRMSVVVSSATGSKEEVELSPAEKLRDIRWGLIEPLIGDNRIYWRKHRGRLVEARAKETGASEQTIMTCLRLYWRGGMTKDALLAAFAQCGTPKDVKSVANQKVRGRDPKKQRYEKYQWKSEDEKREVLKVASSFFKKKNTNTRRFVNRQVVRKLYSVVGADKKIRQRPPGERPSAAQVLYLLDKNQTLEGVLRRKHGDDNFENNFSPKTGSARNYANGIGQYYEIDSTIPDVWVCSEDDPATVIGKATLYLIVDVYSRLIVGFHLTLDKPSWSSALEAMMSLVEDKEQLCKRWDYEYRAERWVAHGYWPSFFRADRGSEMTGHDSDTISDNMETGLINVPRRKAPRKGTVECSFKLIHVPLKDHVGGYTPPSEMGRRQTDDKRGQATRTLKSIGQEILAAIELQNQKVHMRVQLPAAEVYQGVQAIPTAMWQRDYEERAGMLTQYPADYLRFKLLPKSDKFTVTPVGVHFKGLLWEPSPDEKMKWLLAAKRGFYKVTATFHRNLVDCIYVHDLKDPTKWTTMHLTDRSIQHMGRSFAEVESVADAKVTLDDLAYEHNLALEIQHDEAAEAREKKARAETSAALKKAAGSSRTNGAVDKRAKEAKKARANTKVLASTAVGAAPAPAPSRPQSPASAPKAAPATPSPVQMASTSANTALQALLNLRKK